MNLPDFMRLLLDDESQEKVRHLRVRVAQMSCYAWVIIVPLVIFLVREK